MAKKVPPLTVALTHPELGCLIVNETDVPAWKEKGWSVEGEEVVELTRNEAKDPQKYREAKEAGAKIVVDEASSRSVTVKQAVEVISGLDSAEAVTAYTDGDARKGVCDAADARLEELDE